MKLLKMDQKKTYQTDAALTETVAGILSDIKENGDAALLAYAQKFDNNMRERAEISKEEVAAAYRQVSAETVETLKFAAAQIGGFAKKQLACMRELETESGVAGITLGHRLIPVETCGCYVPGGRYPLPSSALMSVLVAKIAGVPNVYACCPPSKEHGTIHPVVLVAMDIAGADKIYCMGGAQAIGAFAYGTQSVGKVDLIVGPGNKFVNEAKRQVMGTVGIDSLAGPSEVLIIADDTAEPEFVAIDILAQCEHDPNASAELVTTSETLANRVLETVERLKDRLPTGETAYRAWTDNGRIVLAESMEEAIAIANDRAPEHLEVQTADEDAVAAKLHNYGSLFIGSYTPVTFGDYCSGTNHILPTMQTAKFSNGVWVGTFIKTAFYQKATEDGCRALAEPCMRLAELEGLCAHKESVAIRTRKPEGQL